MDYHLVQLVLLEAALAEAAGGAEGARILYSARRLRNFTLADKRRAQEEDDRVGREGEEFIHDHLSRLQTAGGIEQFEWESDQTPFAPFDFRVVESAANSFVLDVKATRGAFGTAVHISRGQLELMANAPVRYDLYRVYEMNTPGRTAKLRVAAGVKPFATAVLATLAGLPAGVTTDQVSVDPAAIGFDPAVIELTLDPDDE